MVWIITAAAGVVLASLLSIAGVLFVRRSPRLTKHLGENEVPGFMFGALGVLYGALLAFVVFGTFDNYTRAEQAVTAEGADLVVVYRDSQVFPDPQKAEVQAALRTYTNKVMATEWASHGNLIVHTTPDLLNPIWDLYRQIQPTTSMGETQLAAANDRLSQLELQRHLRHLSAEATLPGIFWPVLLVGSIIVVIFSFLFHQTSVRVQATMTALVTAMLSLVLFLIFSLNQPFTGPIPVSQQPLQHALAQFDALDLQPTP